MNASNCERIVFLITRNFGDSKVFLGGVCYAQLHKK